jgi:hypothetical protein
VAKSLLAACDQAVEQAKNVQPEFCLSDGCAQTDDKRQVWHHDRLQSCGVCLKSELLWFQLQHKQGS